MKIAEVKHVAPLHDGSAIVVKATALVGHCLSDVEIAITSDLAPSVAIALLATTSEARAARDGLTPALEVLAAAVVASGCAEKVRLQLLFDKGAVLPIELPLSAAEPLKRDLLGTATQSPTTGSASIP